MLINDPNNNFADFSKTTNENIGQIDVPTVFESSVSHVSHDDFALQIQSRKKHAIGKPLPDSERERKEKVLWSVLHSRCQGKINGTVFVWVWRVSAKFYSDGWDLREHLQRRDRQAGISGTFRSEKMKLDWVPHGYPEFEAKNFRIRIDWVTAGAWISKTTLIGSQSEQAQRERIHSCSELGMKDHLHQESCARSCPEIERISKDAAMPSRGNSWKTTKIGRISLHSMIRNHEQWVYSSTILTHRAVLAVPTFRIKLLLPRVQESLAAKLECREIHERVWVFLETFLIVNMLDEILMNCTMIQEIWQDHR